MQEYLHKMRENHLSVSILYLVAKYFIKRKFFREESSKILFAKLLTAKTVYLGVIK